MGRNIVEGSIYPDSLHSGGAAPLQTIEVLREGRT